MRFARKQILWAFLVVLLLRAWFPSPGAAQPLDKTMLMFVGEDQRVVSAASRFPEPPEAAPAITAIVDRKSIEDRGLVDLADALSIEPGFYMSPEARGTKPFFRGMANGLLFLYDGVPITTDVTKDFHPLDREMPLYGVERVEIVKGPGSVLWGPDAYAGVVNVVPMRGRDHKGLRTGAFTGSHGLAGLYANQGLCGKGWDAFMSVYGAREYFHDRWYLDREQVVSSDGVALGEAEVNPSRYYGFTANMHVGDWLALSGRYSDFTRRYTMRDVRSMRWAGERSSPMRYLKATLSNTVGASHLSLTAYYEYVKYALTDVDFTREQKNRIYSIELLWDRRMWSKGLLTAGVSYRKNLVRGAVVCGDFLPDFLKPSNTVFVPEVEQADFDNRLSSAFVQYRHWWDHVQWWVGLRLDDHSQYESTFSYSAGFNWPFAQEWRLKGAYGTAYRSPYSRQLFGGRSFDPEGIRTLSFELSWAPSARHRVSLSGFRSHIRDYIQEDPYGGLSHSGKQDLLGMELTAATTFAREFDIKAGLAWVDDSDGTASYRILRYAFIRPDGSRREVYDSWTQPFYTGPHLRFQGGLTWRFAPKAHLVVDVEKSSRVKYSYSKNTSSGTYSQPLLMGVTLRANDTFIPRSSITLRLTNIFDRDYDVPGVYGPVHGPGRSIYLELSKRF